MFYKQSPKKLVILDILEVMFSTFSILNSIMLVNVGKNREYLYLLFALGTLFCLYHGIVNLIHDVLLLKDEKEEQFRLPVLKHTISCNK